MLDLLSAVACAAAENSIAGFKEVYMEVYTLQQYCYKCTILVHQVYHVSMRLCLWCPCHSSLESQQTVHIILNMVPSSDVGQTIPSCS